MSKPLSFQQVILTLQDFWAGRGCLIWQPYNHQVGAGTMNPATYLRVLGPEPWNVAYVEPSIRPDDGRYGDNPNRMQQHTQFQVILKPDPGRPQETYLESLAAIGIDRVRHDIRFVEDNWESPALGAWGLGWEVWLDGLEITQFTYFQQAGGVVLDPVSVEITYGLERIVMFLQDKRSVWDIDYDGRLTYGDVFLRPEVEHNIYNYELADVERLRQMYALYEAEARALLAHQPPLVVPAHDFVLKCSHAFNLLDARGAIGVTERAGYFGRMRDLARQVAAAYVEQRQAMEYPWIKEQPVSSSQSSVISAPPPAIPLATQPTTFVFEIGTEELPARDVAAAIKQLTELVPSRFRQLRLKCDYDHLKVMGTPRRLVIVAPHLAPQQEAGAFKTVKGPAAQIAFDKNGKPTQAALGWAKKVGLPADTDLMEFVTEDGRYLEHRVKFEVKPTFEVLRELLPMLILEIDFDKEMRWNASKVAFSRPIRWLVALLGDQVIPFEFAGVSSGRVTRGPRPAGSPEIEIKSADDYLDALKRANIIAEVDARRSTIVDQMNAVAATAGGSIPDDPNLLEEVTNLVEQPTALLGSFEEKYLALPKDVLVTVMKKHQRYFPIANPQTHQLANRFIAIRNGDAAHLDIVTHGNESVLRARYADAEYFYKHDVQKKLEDYLPRLGTLTFQAKLGSMLDRARRIEALTPKIAAMVGLSGDEFKVAQRAAHLCKADLVTKMVVDFTSLQGIMGREYGRLSGESEAAAEAIFEHYLPRHAGDQLPQSKPGVVVGLADRLDSLIGLFAIGLAPTGSADPWALRRAALGVVQVLIDRQASFPLRDALRLAAETQPVKVEDKSIDEVLAFIAGRLRVALLDRGLRHDAVDAVLAVRAADPALTAREATALAAWMRQTDWGDVLSNYARCARITRDLKERLPLDTRADTEPATAQLREAYDRSAAQVKARPDVNTLLAELRGMKPIIFAFFDKVLVMAEDEVVRKARLGLVQHIAAMSEGIVDLSRVEGF